MGDLLGNTDNELTTADHQVAPPLQSISLAVCSWIMTTIYQTCESRCTADDFLNVVGNSTLEDRVGGIADMG